MHVPWEVDGSLSLVSCCARQIEVCSEGWVMWCCWVPGAGCCVLDVVLRRAYMLLFICADLSIVWLLSIVPLSYICALDQRLAQRGRTSDLMLQLSAKSCHLVT